MSMNFYLMNHGIQIGEPGLMQYPLDKLTTNHRAFSMLELVIVFVLVLVLLDWVIKLLFDPNFWVIVGIIWLIVHFTPLLSGHNATTSVQGAQNTSSHQALKSSSQA